MLPPSERAQAVELDPALAALLADPRLELCPPSQALPIDAIRLGAKAFLTRVAGPDLHLVSSLVADDEAGAVPLRQYRASDRPGLPIILFVHGGGFVFGDLDTHDAICRNLALETGAAIVAVDYQLAPEAPFPAASDDCFRSLTWLMRNGAALGLDTSRVAIAGDSAGGQIAVATALRAHDAGIALRHLALLYPLIDPGCSSPSSHRFDHGFMLSRAFLLWCWDSYAGSPDQIRHPLFDVRLAQLGDLPPVTIVTAGYDPLRDEGMDFADRLERDGVEVSRRHYPDMIHGFAGLPGITPRAIDALRDLGADLRRALAGLQVPTGPEQ